MSPQEIERLLARMRELRILHPGTGDMATWLGVLRDVRFDDAVSAVETLRVTVSRPVTPDDLLVTVMRAREFQMGPGHPDAVRPAHASARAEVVPTPPWTHEAARAAHAASRECLNRGLTLSNPISVASAREAALDVQRQWEDAHGRWDDVWRTWQDNRDVMTSPPLRERDAVTSHEDRRTSW